VETVAPVATEDRVARAGAVEPVVAGVSEQRVLARAAGERVLAVTAAQVVIAGATVDVAAEDRPVDTDAIAATERQDRDAAGDRLIERAGDAVARHGEPTGVRRQ